MEHSSPGPLRYRPSLSAHPAPRESNGSLQEAILAQVIPARAEQLNK